MKKTLVALLFTALLAASCGNNGEQKVMARAVPERADDFVFENNLVAGRFYGKALEGNPTSPGLDIWVKQPGALVADTWYAEAQKDPGYYHHDHGGKDCYKVAVSLGGGASVPYIDNKLRYPATNYRTSEVKSITPDEVTFVLEYPAWDAYEGISVSLSKEVTLRADSYFADVTDTYTFTGTDSLTIAAGIKLHGAQDTVVKSMFESGVLAIWERASDQGAEPEDGLIGVALVMPDAEEMGVIDDHAVVFKMIGSGQPVSYRIGSCWSKARINKPEKWFSLVKKQMK